MIAALTSRCRAFLAHDVLRFATLVAAAAFLIDWTTKSWALERVEHAAIPLGALMLGVERNDAFAFSIGDGTFAPGLILVLRLLAVAGVLLLSRQVGARSRRFAAGFALLAAGGFGNAADLMLRGAVVDFIHAGPFHWAGEPVHAGFVFNAADIAILLALGLLAPLIQEWAVGGQRRLTRWEARWLRSGRDTE
ncbi:MAG: signal peptidase II [Longimicrobiales bacterium]